MDFIAIISMGFYPTPTPTTAERAAFVATYGLSSLSGGGNAGRGLSQLGMSLKI